MRWGSCRTSASSVFQDRFLSWAGQRLRWAYQHTSCLLCLRIQRVHVSIEAVLAAQMAPRMGTPGPRCLIRRYLDPGVGSVIKAWQTNLQQLTELTVVRGALFANCQTCEIPRPYAAPIVRHTSSEEGPYPKCPSCQTEGIYPKPTYRYLT